MYETMSDFGERVRRLLKKQGKTTYAFEEDTGIDRRILYASSRKGTPNRSTLMAMAYYLGVTVEELVDGTEMEAAWYR